MHPYLIRLGVSPEVQAYFFPFYNTDETGNLLFVYGDGFEHFGFAFHRVPLSENFWVAGNTNFSQVRQVIICSSAMAAISWLNKNYYSLSNSENRLFLSTGAGVQLAHIRWINLHLRDRDFCLVFGRDILGRIADLKLAAGIRGWPLEIYFNNDKIIVAFRSRTFSFSQETFSLNAFEKAAGYRFHIPTPKPKGHDDFFEELKANARLTF